MHPTEECHHQAARSFSNGRVIDGHEFGSGWTSASILKPYCGAVSVWQQDIVATIAQVADVDVRNKLTMVHFHTFSYITASNDDTYTCKHAHTCTVTHTHTHTHVHTPPPTTTTTLHSRAKNEPAPSSMFNVSILQIESTTNTDELQQLLSEDDFLFCLDSGYTKPLAHVTVQDKEEMIQIVALDYLVYRSQAETDQLIEGLKTADILGLLRKHPLQMSALFHGGHQELTADTVADLLEPQYSDIGSNAKEIEESLMFNMEICCRKLKEEV